MYQKIYIAMSQNLGTLGTLSHSCLMDVSSTKIDGILKALSHPIGILGIFDLRALLGSPACTQRGQIDGFILHEFQELLKKSEVAWLENVEIPMACGNPFPVTKETSKKQLKQWCVLSFWFFSEKSIGFMRGKDGKMDTTRVLLTLDLHLVVFLLEMGISQTPSNSKRLIDLSVHRNQTPVCLPSLILFWIFACEHLKRPLFTQTQFLPPRELRRLISFFGRAKKTMVSMFQKKKQTFSTGIYIDIYI